MKYRKVSDLKILRVLFQLLLTLVIVVWSSDRKETKRCSIEIIQKSAMKIAPNLMDMVYEERLERLSLHTEEE